MLREKFRRSRYNSENIIVKNIYPKGWNLIVFAIEMFIVFLAIYFYKINVKHGVTILCMLIFYVVALVEFFLRFLIKDKYFKNGYVMGANTPFYHNTIKMLIFICAGMGLICTVYLFGQSLHYTGTNFVYEYYWIWCGLICFLVCFEPFNLITSGFNDSFFLTDKYVVDYSEVSEIRIVKERPSTKGVVCEIEIFKGDLKVGTDRVFEEDLIQLQKMKNINRQLV